jgi:hypothetical protein
MEHLHSCLIPSRSGSGRMSHWRAIQMRSRPSADLPRALLDKTQPIMAEWPTHDESFMFAQGA